MAITQQLARLTSRQLEACSSDADELRRVCWYTGLPKKDHLDLNWWLNILRRAAQDGDAPANVLGTIVTAIDGNREVFPDSQAIAQVYSEVTCLDVAETAEIAAGLAAVDLDALMAVAAKDDEVREYMVDIRAAFEQLREFYRVAAARGLAVMLWWD